MSAAESATFQAGYHMAGAVLLVAGFLALLGFALMAVYALMIKRLGLGSSKLAEDVRYLYRVSFFLVFTLLASQIVTSAARLLGS